MLLSLAALAAAIVALMRPQRDVVRLAARVSELSSLRTEWADTLSALDSMNKRAARLARIELGPQPRNQNETAIATDGRRRTLSLAEVQGRKEA